MSQFSQNELDTLRMALNMPKDSSTSKLTFSNSLLELAKHQSVLWPLLANDRLDGTNPIVKALTIQTTAASQALAIELIETHKTLSKFCEPIYLKGAATVVEHDFQPLPWRFMADIDFLLSKEDLLTAINSFKNLKYRNMDNTRYVPGLMLHFPMIQHPEKKYGVEIHTRCLVDDLNGIFDPEALRNRAQTISTHLGPVLIPDINDRIIHLIAHAQINSRRYHRHRFLFRDALELRYLLNRPNADIKVAEKTFKSAGYEKHFHTFVALSRAFASIDQLDRLPEPKYVSQWKARTMRSILDPKTQNFFLVADWLRQVSKIILTPSQWSDYLEMIFNRNITFKNKFIQFR